MREYEPTGYCRTCGARDGELCITGSGNLAAGPHAGRVHSAPSLDTRRRQHRRHTIPVVTRRALLRRSGGWCEVCPVIDGNAPRHPGEEAHHVRRRSQGGNDALVNLRWTCRRGHRLVHDNPARAAALDLLERTTAKVN